VLEALHTDDLDVADFQIVLANPAALQLARLPVDRVVGRRLSALFPGITQGEVFRRMKRTLLTGQPDRFEWQHTYYY